MARIYLIRHAQSIANAERKYQGQSYDTDLSPLGKKQAATLAKALNEEKVDKIVSSPLRRTMQTAHVVSENKNIKVETEQLLIESDHGDWEGKTFDDLAYKYADIWHVWHTHPANVKFPNGETMKEISHRVIRWWDKVSRENANIVAVTHENIIQALLVHLQRVGLDRIWDFRLRNASITEVVVHSPPAIVRIGDIGHLIEAGL